MATNKKTQDETEKPGKDEASSASIVGRAGFLPYRGAVERSPQPGTSKARGSGGCASQSETGKK